MRVKVKVLKDFDGYKKGEERLFLPNIAREHHEKGLVHAAEFVKKPTKKKASK